MILMTGGTGGIGSELLLLLSEAAVRARALTRNLQKDRHCLASHGLSEIWLDPKH
jgi:uncharacterized protein YbjT (DUF2867 family)